MFAYGQAREREEAASLEHFYTPRETSSVILVISLSVECVSRLRASLAARKLTGCPSG